MEMTRKEERSALGLDPVGRALGSLPGPTVRAGSEEP